MPIFLSYRRGSTEHAVGRIFDRLRERLPDEEVFYDVDNIPLGVDFADYLRSWVDRSDLFIVVIGPDWNVERLRDEGDFVRIEVEAALRKGIPVIPVLVNGVDTVPAAEALPESIRALSMRQAVRIGAGADFAGHIEILLRGVQDHLRAGNGAVAREAGEEAAQVSAVTATDSVTAEGRYQALRQAAVVDRIVMWTLGTLTGGVSYFFVGRFVFRRAEEILGSAGRGEESGWSGTGWRLGVAVGLGIAACAWALAVGYLYLVVIKPKVLYERYVGIALSGAGILFWISTSILLGWLWSSARALGVRRQRLHRLGRALPAAWRCEDGTVEFDAQRQLLGKTTMYVLFFPFYVYVVAGLQASLMEGATDVGPALAPLFVRVGLIIAIALLVVSAGTQLCRELIHEFIDPRAGATSWFWPATLLNLAAGCWGFYVVNHSVLSGLL